MTKFISNIKLQVEFPKNVVVNALLYKKVVKIYLKKKLMLQILLILLLIKIRLV